MSKKEFMRRISGMKNPKLEEHSSDRGWKMANMYWIIWDKSNLRNKFELPGVLLKTQHPSKMDLDNYIKREDQHRKKYNKWLHEYLKSRNVEAE